MCDPDLGCVYQSSTINDESCDRNDESCHRNDAMFTLTHMTVGI